MRMSIADLQKCEESLLCGEGCEKTEFWRKCEWEKGGKLEEDFGLKIKQTDSRRGVRCVWLFHEDALLFPKLVLSDDRAHPQKRRERRSQTSQDILYLHRIPHQHSFILHIFQTFSSQNPTKWKEIHHTKMCKHTHSLSLTYLPHSLPLSITNKQTHLHGKVTSGEENERTQSADNAKAKGEEDGEEVGEGLA